MPDGRGARIALEAGFLLVVAAGLAVAAVTPAWIVAVMLLAWLIVALLEWVSWREQAHWASGLPPRYYVPPQPLPPRPPGRELPAFSAYPRPAPREPEAPTWIATPAMREQLLGWPGESAEPMPPAAGELAPTTEELHDELLAEAASAGAAPEEDGAAGWPAAEPAPAVDRWAVAELPAEPVVVEHAPEPEPGVIVPQIAPPPSAPVRLALHRIDPFAEPAGSRWSRRQTPENGGAVAELPALPRHARVPPREPGGGE